VVTDILSGEYSTPVAVVAVNLSEGWARDVSKDVAGAVVTKARAEGHQLTEGVTRFAKAQLDEDVEPELVQR
jgi:hypothetical protein